MKITNYFTNLKYSFNDEFRMAGWYIDLFRKHTFENDLEYDPSWHMQFIIDGTPYIGMGLKLYFKSVLIRLKG